LESDKAYLNVYKAEVIEPDSVGNSSGTKNLLTGPRAKIDPIDAHHEAIVAV